MESLEHQHGYDESIFTSDTPDYFHCMICTLVLRDPVQIISCGHKMCALCFDQMKGHAATNDIELRCPADRNLVDLADVREDMYLKRVIGSLTVRCLYHDNGCEWTGELSEVQIHADKCQFNLIKSDEEGLLFGHGVSKALTDRLDHLESSFLGKNNEVIALLKLQSEEQKHLMEDMQRQQQRHTQDMTDLREKNEMLIQKISLLTDENMEWYAKQKSTMDELLSRVAALEIRTVAVKDHGNDACGQTTRNAGKGQQEKRIVFDHHSGDASKVDILNEIHAVQFNEGVTTVKATKAVVLQGARAWYEINCYRSKNPKQMNKWIKVGWATNGLRTSGTILRIGSDPHSYAFSPFKGVKNHNSLSGDQWGRSLVDYGYVGVALDMVKAEILYSLNGIWTKPMGVAFSGIPKDAELFPAISGINCTVNFNFGDQNYKYGPPDSTFVAMVDLV